MRIFRCILLLIAVIVSCYSCKKSTPEPPGPDPDKARTVLAYMVGDNNLYGYMFEDINEMELGWSDNFQGTMLVYFNVPRSKGQKPQILKIQHDTDMSAIKSSVVKQYSEYHDPCDPEVMKMVIADARALAPSNSFGMMYSSHALGWVPAGMPPLKSRSSYSTQPNLPMVKTFGSTYSFSDSEMEIYNMATSLPSDLKMDFIIFDACLMSCVEAMYQLKDKSRYIIASSAEVLANGFPYDNIMEDMFAVQANVKGIGEKYFNHYNSQSGMSRSATVSVVDCAKLPALASAMNKVSNTPTTVSTTGVFYFTGNLTADIYFDLGDYVRKNWSRADLTEFERALSDVFAYRACTANFFGREIKSHSGLTSHIPKLSTPLANDIYRTHYQWSYDSGLWRVIP